MTQNTSKRWMLLAAIGLLAISALPAASQTPPASQAPSSLSQPPAASEAPPASQVPPARQDDKPAVKGVTPGPKGRALPINLIVDAAPKKTWSPDDLQRLAGASQVKWIAPKGARKPHPAIPIWDLLQDAGVSKDSVKELRIAARSKSLTFKGDDLAKVDGLVIRNSAKAIARPWRLAPMDPDMEEKRGALTLVNLTRVEVITTPK